MMDAIEETKEGCIIHIKVKIGKKNIFPAGYDEWKKRIKIEINEEPVKGRANKKIIAMLQSYFSLAPNESIIIYGERCSEKGILVKKKKEEILHILKNES